MQPEPDRAVVRLKGDARMAQVLRRALDARCGTLPANVDLEVAKVRFFVTRPFVETEVAKLRERGAPHAEGRSKLRDRMLVEAIHAYEDAVPDDEMSEVTFPELQKTIRRDAAFKKALDMVWPSIKVERLVADLFASPARLAEVSAEILTDAERKLLRRKRSAPWTKADGPLLDEAKTLIEGPPDHYGHVVADEAQDLSPMQLRMLARRCPAGSMSILGDLGQATGAWAHDDWAEVLEHLPQPDGSRIDELTLGYRVTKAITELSSRILAEAAPQLLAPRSVRREEGEVTFAHSGDLVEGAVEAAKAMLAEATAAALIVPDDLVDDVEAALATAGIDFGDADVDHALTVVPVSQSKGLEFEGVVVLEPAAIVEQGGLRLLYVAVTRAMRLLTIVHAAPMPGSLRPLVARAS